MHPVHVSRTDEEGNVTQDRVWATVAQVADPFCVHARVDINVLQPKFQGLHYGVQTIDEMRRRKRRRAAAIKEKRGENSTRRESAARSVDTTASWCRLGASPDRLMETGTRKARDGGEGP